MRTARNGGLTLVELLISVGIFSVVSLLLVDLMKQPSEIMSNVSNKLSGQESVDAALSVVSTQLSSSGILRTGLLRCIHYNSSFWPTLAPGTVGLFPCTTGMGLTGDICSKVNITSADVSTSLTIPYSVHTEIAAKTTDQTKLTVANGALFPPGAVVAVTQVRNSSKGRVLRVLDTTAAGVLTLGEISETLPAPFNCILHPVGVSTAQYYPSLSSLMTDAGSSLKLFGLEPQILRIDRLAFAAYKTDGSQLVQEILENFPSTDQGPPMRWSTVLVPSGFNELSVNYRWHSDSSSGGGTTPAATGKMFMSFAIDRSEKIEGTQAKFSGRISGKAQYDYLGGAGTNFAANTTAGTARNDNHDVNCTTGPVTPVGGYYSLDNAVADSLQLFEIQVATGTARQQVVGLTVSAPASAPPARCWTLDRIGPTPAPVPPPLTPALPDDGRLFGSGQTDTIFVEITPQSNSVVCALPPLTTVSGSVTYYSNSASAMVTAACGLTTIPNDTITLAWQTPPSCTISPAPAPATGTILTKVPGTILVTRSHSEGGVVKTTTTPMDLKLSSKSCFWDNSPALPSTKDIPTDCGSGHAGTLDRLRLKPGFVKALDLSTLILPAYPTLSVKDPTDPNTKEIEVRCVAGP